MNAPALVADEPNDAPRCDATSCTWRWSSHFAAGSSAGGLGALVRIWPSSSKPLHTRQGSRTLCTRMAAPLPLTFHAPSSPCCCIRMLSGSVHVRRCFRLRIDRSVGPPVFTSSKSHEIQELSLGRTLIAARPQGALASTKIEVAPLSDEWAIIMITTSTQTSPSSPSARAARRGTRIRRKANNGCD